MYQGFHTYFHLNFSFKDSIFFFNFLLYLWIDHVFFLLLKIPKQSQLVDDIQINMSMTSGPKIYFCSLTEQQQNYQSKLRKEYFIT